MTESESTALIGSQFIEGVANGSATANVIVNQFPNGWPKSVTRKVRRIIDDALAHVVHALTAGGVEQKYIDPFAEGFHAGLKQRFTDHASERNKISNG